MLSEFCFSLLVVILVYNSRSSSQSLDQDRILDRYKQYIYEKYLNLSLEKTSNGTGLILPSNGTGLVLSDVLQEKFGRGDLRCDSFCNSIECCVCNIYDESEVDSILIAIEWKNRTIVLPGSPFTRTHLLMSSNKSFNNLPSNICDYPTILKIYLQYNNIKDIDLLSCLPNLDTLILHHNQVEYFSKELFLNMTLIRVIDLSHNRLKYIEPGFLINVNGSLFEFDVSYNYLTTIDITNILWSQLFFCTANFSHNSIHSMTNELEWKSQDSSVFSRKGSIDVSYNNLTYFSIFNEEGLNINHAGKLYFWVFYLEGNPWICDCKFYSIAKPSKTVVKIFNNVNVFLICDSPIKLKTKTLTNIIANSELDQLICNLSLSERCPPQCKCFYQPAINNRTVVNCSRSRLEQIPAALPLNDHLQIDFTNNNITNLKRIEKFKLDVFERIKTLDLSNNQIITISDIVLYRFRKIQLVNMTYNAIKRIPRSLQMLKPCQIALGQIIMKCKCEDFWLKIWLPLQYQSCARNTQVFCEHNGLLRSITEMEKVDLGCPVSNNNASLLNISMCSAFAAVIILASAIFKFRSEFFIFTRSVFNFVKKPVAPNCIKHDIYISANDDDPLVRKWLLTSFVPYLEGKGFGVFLFFRDSAFGAPREQETIDVMSKSRNFVILLSDITNGTQEWNKKEWKYAWNYYKCDFSRNLIVINYDFVKCDDTVKKFFRGFFTLRKVINFSNFDNKIEEDILTLLK